MRRTMYAFAREPGLEGKAGYCWTRPMPAKRNHKRAYFGTHPFQSNGAAESQSPSMNIQSITTPGSDRVIWRRESLRRRSFHFDQLASGLLMILLLPAVLYAGEIGRAHV